MKLLVIISMFLLPIFYSKSSLAQTSLNDSLQNMNLMYYLNKPIDSFLLKIPQSYSSIKTGSGDKSLFEGGGVRIKYNQPYFLITVYANTFNYIPRILPYNSTPQLAWPLSLLKKENIGYIDIMNTNGVIINSTEQ